MLGAIVGDLAESIYEFEQIKHTHPVIIDNIIEKDSFFSDDTILTIAILDVLNPESWTKWNWKGSGLGTIWVRVLTLKD